jgi:serine/threonine protein kinase
MTCETSELIGGKWEKLRRLGFGSYGEVWLVKNPENVEPAVAKVPHSQKMNTKFLREAAILKRLRDHPNAVHLKEVVKQDGKVILIQEYVEGGTLQDLLGQGMEAAAKESAFLQLLEIVARAHADKIMHRDIKPENIIVTHKGILKLLDFGTGKDLTRRSISNTVIGSRPFMAPEQILGNSRLASDVWALGVILYALSTGCLPFYDDNEKVLMDIILESEPERPRNLEPDLSEELESVILKCLEKDWSRRYRSAVELKTDLSERLPTFGQGEILTGA